MQTNYIKGPLNMLKFQKVHFENKHHGLCYDLPFRRVTINGMPYVSVQDVLRSAKVSLLQTQ